MVYQTGYAYITSSTCKDFWAKSMLPLRLRKHGRHRKDSDTLLQKSKVGYDGNGSMVAARPRLAWPVIFVHEIVKTNWKYDCTKKKQIENNIAIL